jgi:hypothetical protein
MMHNNLSFRRYVLGCTELPLDVFLHPGLNLGLHPFGFARKAG